MAVRSDRRLDGAIERGRQVRVVVDGVAVPAFEGECVAAVLLAAGRRGLRATPRRGEPRGMYCCIGLCFECAMVINDQHGVRACVTPVCDGMRVDTPRGAAEQATGCDGAQ
ncbi:MAG TPA: (2Fe-2S)-binding protein [Pilimelia sp.]|nr:(2Fe-2S)-binding protein [Pilimelia sp.]